VIVLEFTVSLMLTDSVFCLALYGFLMGFKDYVCRFVSFNMSAVCCASAFSGWLGVMLCPSSVSFSEAVVLLEILLVKIGVSLFDPCKVLLSLFGDDTLWGIQFAVLCFDKAFILDVVLPLEQGWCWCLSCLNKNFQFAHR
jgi:hypothetical protein